jgi:hypothetical protein
LFMLLEEVREVALVQQYLPMLEDLEVAVVQ